jgi:amidase
MSNRISPADDAVMVKSDLSLFSAAVDMVGALCAGHISAVELLDLHLQRIERLDGPLNSIVVRHFEQARLDAIQADATRSRGEQRPLLGLPVTIKESIDVAGLATTAGVAARSSHRAERDAATVARLRKAGAIVIGKTNVCPWLADLIADNPVYGRTNNPWDLSRTPGGSSGGSAALAAGFSPLDLGSDLGGSIRIPAAFCGLWGHKPSEGAVPNSGHFPGSSLPNAGWLMAAQGPMARSAFDLELALDVLAGPDVGMDAAWRLQFPPARHDRLADFRVAVLPSLDWVPVDPEIVSAIESFADRLRKQGAHVVEMSPPGLGDLREFYRHSRIMMSALVSAHWPAGQRDNIIKDRESRGEFSHSADVLGFRATASDFLKAHEQRERYREGYRDFFRDFDVLLTPMSLVPAFPHPTVPVCDRELEIAGRSIGFDYMTFYPSLASLPGHGATAFPIGLSRSGLPLGAQAIGPFLEDRTPIRFAQLVEQAFGAFTPPPEP